MNARIYIQPPYTLTLLSTLYRSEGTAILERSYERGTPRDHSSTYVGCWRTVDGGGPPHVVVEDMPDHCPESLRVLVDTKPDILLVTKGQ